MRKYLVLTSIFALAACGGGGGSGDFSGHAAHPTIPTNPTVNIQGFDGGTQVNASNIGLTNMSSYTVDYSAGHTEDDAKAAMIAYVNTHLGTLRGDLNRAASNRANRDTIDPTEFERADVAIAQMKQVLYDMVGKPNDAALKTYVSRYRYAVVNALKMQDVAVTNETSIDDLVAAFNTLKGTQGWTPENIMAELDAFDQNQFYIVKHRMETDVKLHNAGDANAYFQFDLDAGGAITRVAMFEGDAPNDYGWFNKNNNPNGNQFVKTIYGYRFTMGNLSTAPNLELTEAQIAAFTWFNGVSGKDDITNLRFNNNSDGDTLSNSAKKAAMKRVINSEIDDFKLSQPNHDHDDDIELVRARYLELIDAAFTGFEDDGHDAVFAQHITPLDLTVTMVGEGKTLSLQYSDFGYVDLNEIQEKADGTFKETHTYVPYAGGYEARTVTPEEDATFVGTAVAGIQWSSQDTNGNRDGNGMLVRNENAELTFDHSTGKSTLVMDNLVNDAGEKWYNVTVSGDFNGEHASDLTFEFDATGKTTNAAYDFISDPEEVAFDASEWNATKNEFKQTNSSDNTIDYRGNAGVDYYGETSTSAPSEVTATFSFSEEQHIDDGHGNESHHEVAIYGAYGGH